jgi:hypothetical protein
LQLHCCWLRCDAVCWLLSSREGWSYEHQLLLLLLVLVLVLVLLLSVRRASKPAGMCCCCRPCCWRSGQQ